MKIKIFALCSFLLANIASANSVKSVNFFQEGEISKLVIDLEREADAEKFHAKNSKQIFLDIKNVTADKKTLRPIDTSEFPGSLVLISGYKRPGEEQVIRFALQLRDNVRSRLEKRGSQIVLDVENRFGAFSQSELGGLDSLDSEQVVSTSDPGSSADEYSRLKIPKSSSTEDLLENITQSGPKKYLGRRISINVRDIDIVSLLNMIAEVSGFNIIMDREVSTVPPLTLTLTNIPWDQALDTILNIGKLVAEKNGNILQVTTLEKATKEKEDQLKNAQVSQLQEPLVTKIFAISFANLDDIIAILKEYQTPERGRISKDERTNSLIVKDTIGTIDSMKKIVDLLDTQTPQILIESKIVEANESYIKRMGINNDGGLQFGYDPIQETLGESQGVLNVAQPLGLSFSSAPLPGTDLLGVSIGIYNKLTGLTFRLQLMEFERQGRIISSPKIITQNKKKAEITSRFETSYQVVNVGLGLGGGGGGGAGGAGGGAGAGGGGGAAIPQVTYEQIEADITLAVTPQVTNEGSIAMEVEVNKGSFSTDGVRDGAPPNRTNRNIKTNVLVDNGSTVVIGGLYTTNKTESVAGIPFLKDIPIIGWLFRSAYNPEEEKDELIIFLTPRIINQEEAGLSAGSNLSNLDL